MFKVSNNVTPIIIDELFTKSHSYNLRSKFSFVIPSVRTVYNGQNSIYYHDPLILNETKYSRMDQVKFVEDSL